MSEFCELKSGLKENHWFIKCLCYITKITWSKSIFKVEIKRKVPQLLPQISGKKTSMKTVLL